MTLKFPLSHYGVCFIIRYLVSMPLITQSIYGCVSNDGKRSTAANMVNNNQNEMQQ